MEKVFEIYIKTTPERLWEAITDPDLREVYSFGVRTETDYAPGSTYESFHPSMESPSSRARTSRSTRRGGSCSR